MVNPSRIIKTDVLIIGAGLIGSAVAMGLARLGCKSVTVIDLDQAGEWSSSELNAGGVRATWSQDVNILISKLSIDYFASVADQVGYRDCGYLWLHRKETWEAALKIRKKHLAHHWPVEELNVPTIQTRYPFIDKVDDLVGALYGSKDGLVNPNRLKEHYREQAFLFGKDEMRFMDGVWVHGCEYEGKKLRVEAFQFSERMSSEQKKSLLSGDPTSFDSQLGEQIEFDADTVVNCAGAWAPQIANLLGYQCPSKPVRRQISIFHARGVDLTPYGMIVDPSGVYFHPEAVYGLSGFAVPGEPEGFRFHYDGEDFFQNHIWPHLAERSSQFESLRHVSGWSGLYENSPDHHAIIGKAGPGIFEAHSFSGHGAMQSYAAGVGLAEKIIKGRYETIDLGELSADRFVTGRKIQGESWVI